MSGSWSVGLVFRRLSRLDVGEGESLGAVWGCCFHGVGEGA